jgi:hypothetical protein
MAEPLDPQSMSNEEGAQRLADTSGQMEEIGAELRALSPADPCSDVAAVIRHLYLITDQHALMLESLRRRVERLEEGRALPTPDTRR